MKLFVTGATGAIGRPLVPLLVAAGHEVIGLARSDEKAAQLEAAGATPARVSLFDVGGLTAAMQGCDAVANLATAVPRMTAASLAGAWQDHVRIRSEGSTAVTDAALAAGVGRLVQESITFGYADGGDRWIDEDFPVDLPRSLTSTSVCEANPARFAAAGEGRVGVVLRFAAFYGAGSHHTEDYLAMARRHIGPMPGAPDTYISSIHLDDAASAVVAALAAPSGTYNVADDEPVTKRQYARAISAAVGKRPWIYLPGRGTRLSKSAAAVRRSHRVANRRFRGATGWAPAYPSFPEGIARVVAELNREAADA